MSHPEMGAGLRGARSQIVPVNVGSHPQSPGEDAANPSLLRGASVGLGLSGPVHPPRVANIPVLPESRQHPGAGLCRLRARLTQLLPLLSTGDGKLRGGTGLVLPGSPAPPAPQHRKPGSSL